jgi:hypothetical protein
MKTVFLRDLRRLAPYALALYGLIAIFGLIAANIDGMRWKDSVAIASILAAGFLAVATVAPDTDSGAVAFLARLPLAPWRIATAKLAAAAVWTLSCLSMAYVAQEGSSSGQRDVFEIGAFAFACGGLASAAANRTLPAAIMTGVIAGVTVSGVGIPAALLDAHGVVDPRGIFFDAVCLAFVGAAVFTYARGDRHRASWRPALIASAAVLLTCTAALGTVAAAHGLQVRDAPSWLTVRESVVTSPGGRYAVVTLSGTKWAAHEQRVAVIDRNDATVWLLPMRFASAPEVSPDGSKLLVRNAEEPGGWLVDLASREITPLGAPFADVEKVYEGFAATVIWKGDEPFFASDLGRIEVRDKKGKPVASAPFHGRVAGTAGEWIISLSESGAIAFVHPWSAWWGGVCLEGSERAFAVLVSPSGKRVAILGEREDGKRRVFLVEVATREQHALDVEPSLTGFEDAVFSPDESSLALGVPREVIVLDFAKETVRTFAEAPDATGHVNHPTWSLDGAELLLQGGTTVNVATGRTHQGTEDIVTLVTPRVGVVAGEALAFRDIESGAVVARPFGGR